MSEDARVAWITRDPTGRATGISAVQPAVPEGHTIEMREWDAAFAIVRAEWFPTETEETS